MPLPASRIGRTRRVGMDCAFHIKKEEGEKMFKKILYPTDFSDVSEKAIRYIEQLKDSGLEEVILLHVIDSHGSESIRPFLASDEFEMLRLKMKGEVEEYLQRTEKQLQEMGLTVKTLVRTGLPVKEILKAEGEEDISMIVIGSHGVSNVEEIFLGSVSEKVIRKCKKPVLVVKR
jgi:nucleotide-binding universal stress UspA family protein